MKKLLLAGIMLAASACATGYQPAYIYSELLVVNNSGEVLDDVRVTLTGIDRSFDCGDVVALGVCSKRFGKRRYQYEPLVIEWAAGGGPRRSDEFVIDVPLTFSPGAALRAVLAVSETGVMTAYFEQESLRR